ncbi:carbohydrate kinase family protein [Stutzerimonas azotifigens]|uniref:carbohydrate kinase family protein n=1 Tax=Stutzerimonas azotifigens TaxID=291995 RepID=UPI0003F68703|nr:carbohydrate kinase [Stutzerimonas azotifigens]
MFLVCGEALFDLFASPARPGVANRLTLEAVAGGSPFNVAVGLARLGVPAALFTGLSTDPLGNQLLRVLQDEGVERRFLVRFDAPTTLATVGVGADGSPVYGFRGDGCADRLPRLKHLPALDDAIRAIHLGSYSLVVPPVADTLLALVEREQGRRLISLDPNVRLNVEPDAGVWRGRVEALARYAHLIKVSDEDLRALYPHSPAEAIAESWLGERCELVLLTRGSGGASVFSRRHGALHLPAQATRLCDTVGAGDTFQAAVLAWLHARGLAGREALGSLSRADLGAMLGVAIAAASVTCSRTGPDLPRRHEVPGLSPAAG